MDLNQGQPQNPEPMPMMAQTPPTPSFNYKSVGIRFLAILIDWIIFGVVLGAISAAVGSTEGGCDSATYVGATITLDGRDTFYGLCGWPAGVYVLAGLVYFIILEWLWGGTLGKLAVGIRVRTWDGQPIGFKESLIRNLIRIIDALPFCIPYLLGAVLVWTSGERQRLGDRAARTIVIGSSD